MYYIFGEYKVQDSELTPLYHVGGIIADIKGCELYKRYLSYIGSNLP